MKKKNITGFMLIELLVVIALLLAILTPSLRKAKERTRTILYRSNLKQYGLATGNAPAGEQTVVEGAGRGGALAGHRHRVIESTDIGGTDSEGNALDYRWWQYQEADSYGGTIKIKNANKQRASFKVPKDAKTGETIHVVIEITDSGTPPLTRYKRVVAEIK